MAAGLTEEIVTKLLLSWLEGNGWEIICFDFPQSGTGVYLHPENSKSKNFKSVIPDIVAFRHGQVVYFENKDHFYLKDFEKVQKLRNTTEYNKAFSRLLGDRKYHSIVYGIGLPLLDSVKKKALKELSLTDFIVFINEETVETVGQFGDF